MSNAASKLLSTNRGGIAELKHRLLFLVFGIFVFRLGAHIPTPGLNPEKIAHFFNNQQNTLLGFVNMFSGGALQRLSIFAIGIMPYISASIIIQLFTAINPTLKQLQKEGEQGRRKINQYTRYGTLLLGLIQSFGISVWLQSSGFSLYPGATFLFTTTATLVTGTMFLMWLGEQMTERGIGNGISMIIFAGIVSRLPSAIGQVFEQVREGQMQAITLLLVVTIVVVVTAFVVFVERGQRRIKVNYAQRQQGRKVYAAQTSHLPLKLNMSGVIPPIFASSILTLPAFLAKSFSSAAGMGWLGGIGLAMAPGSALHMLLYSVAIVFFAFFYTALQFNPKDTADNLKKSGAFIPGIRPGEQTASYIDNVMTRLTLVGSIYLVLVCLLPELFLFHWHIPFYFGGTSLLIIVVVIMDFMAQVQALLMSYQYESVMKKANLKGGMPGMNLTR